MDTVDTKIEEEIKTITQIDFVNSLPASWEQINLGDVVNILDSKRVPLNEQQRQSRQGIYPYCGANGILGYLNDYLFDGEYILLAEDGGYWGAFESSAYLMKGKFWVNNHAHVLEAKERRANSSYLVHYLNYSNIKSFINGSTRGKLNQGIMQKVPVILPPLSQQHIIVSILQTVQKTIQARRQELELEREHKAALLVYLFTYGTYNEQLKQTKIGEIPESWAVLKVGDVVTLQRGFDITRKEQKPGLIPVISSSGIHSFHDIAMVKGPGVIIGRKGSLGTAFYIEGDYWPHDTTLWVKDFHNNHPKFVYYLLKSMNFSHFDVGSSNPTLNRNHVHNIEMGLPTFDEQRTIAEILSACDIKIDALEHEVVILEELFRALLEELMTGRISTLPLIEKEKEHE